MKQDLGRHPPIASFLPQGLKLGASQVGELLLGVEFFNFLLDGHLFFAFTGRGLSTLDGIAAGGGVVARRAIARTTVTIAGRRPGVA